MAKIDLVRRAEIGREKRAKTRALILEAGAILLAERARHTPQFHVSAIVLVLLGLLSVGT